MLSSAWLALVISLALALAWLRLCDFAAQRGWVSSDLSRKLIHIGTGPLFVLTWLLFPNVPEARWLAAIIPLGITAQFALVGLGVMRDESAVKAMSRTGDRHEILRGPLYYGVAFVALTLLFWKESPVGMVALMLLCGGDGLADVLGRRIQSIKLPWSPKKSVIGSAAMFLGGFGLSLAVLAVYRLTGALPGSLRSEVVPVALIAFAGMLVESLPFSDLDNLSVPLVAALLGMFLFG